MKTNKPEKTSLSTHKHT